MDAKLDKKLRIAINNAFYNQQGKMLIHQSDMDSITFFKSMGYADDFVHIDFKGYLGVYDHNWDSFYTLRLKPIVYDVHLKYVRAIKNAFYSDIYVRKSQIYPTLEAAKTNMANQVQYRQNLNRPPIL